MMTRTTNIAYIDLLTVLACFFMMTTALLLSVNHEISKGNVIEKAEFIATLEWDSKSNSDIDLWARNPLGDIVFFRNKDKGLMNLERDDLGLSQNMITGPDGKPIYDPFRKEVISVRGIIPGQHVFNVMLYGLGNNDTLPIKAHVEIIKLNPYEVIIDKDVRFDNLHQEITVGSFTVNADGRVYGVDTSTQVSLTEGLIK